MEALNYMVKCRPSTNKIPYLQLIASMETVAKEMEEMNMGQVAKFRVECARIISRASPPVPVVPKHLNRLLKELSKKYQDYYS